MLLPPLVLVGATAAIDACSSSPIITQGVPDAAIDAPLFPLRPLRILFFTLEAPFEGTDSGYHHPDAHAVGDTAVPNYLRARGHTVTVSNDPTLFTDTGLAPFDVIFFFVTCGEFMGEAGRGAFQSFIESGRGFAGIHTASITEHNWQFMHDLIGTEFLGHELGPYQIEDGSLIVADVNDPLVSFLPNPWQRTDEWYYFTDNPATIPSLHSLLRLDESSVIPNYPEAGLIGNHPLAWTQEFHSARMFYTALGHTGESYTEELLLENLALGVEWAGAPNTVNP